MFPHIRSSVIVGILNNLLFLRRIDPGDFQLSMMDTYLLSPALSGITGESKLFPQVDCSAHCSLRSFGRYLSREQLLEVNPFVGIRTPKLERRLPQFLDVPEIDHLMELPTNTILGRRDLAILELLYGAGIRVSELTGLTLSQIDLTERYVLVFGKGSKERIRSHRPESGTGNRSLFAEQSSVTWYKTGKQNGQFVSES